MNSQEWVIFHYQEIRIIGLSVKDQEQMIIATITSLVCNDHDLLIIWDISQQPGTIGMQRLCISSLTESDDHLVIS